MKFKFKSKLNICMASKPRTITITHEDAKGGKWTEVLGNISTICRWCGKPWDKH